MVKPVATKEEKGNVALEVKKFDVLSIVLKCKTTPRIGMLC